MMVKKWRFILHTAQALNSKSEEARLLDYDLLNQITGWYQQQQWDGVEIDNLSKGLPRQPRIPVTLSYISKPMELRSHRQANCLYIRVRL